MELASHRIQTVVSDTQVAWNILDWARQFRTGQLAAEDVQDRFATIDVAGLELPAQLTKALAAAQQELDAIRYGMCEAGQRGEMHRIFAGLERAIRQSGLH